MGEALHITIYTREGTMLDSDVVNVSSFNDQGPFDVLKQHARFISIIKNRLMVRFASGATNSIPVDNGIMRVRENKIEVYLGIKH